MPADTDESTREPEELHQDAPEAHSGVLPGIHRGHPADRRKGVPAPPLHRESELATKRSGNIVYLDGASLEKSLHTPKIMIAKALIIIVIAIVLGVLFLGAYFDSVVNGPVREQELVDEYVSKEVDLNLPELQALVSLDDAAITAALEADGDTIFVRSQAAEGKPFEAIKLPEGVSLADAAALYLKGISSLSASEAAKLLNGSWDLTVNRDNGMNMGIHYADFSSGSVERAVSSAARSQGFDTEGNVDSGVDSSGNTYIQGALDIGGESYSWKVSAVPLSDIYSQHGLPEDAVYVGIRLYR